MMRRVRDRGGRLLCRYKHSKSASTNSQKTLADIHGVNLFFWLARTNMTFDSHFFSTLHSNQNGKGSGVFSPFIGVVIYADLIFPPDSLGEI